MNVEENLIYKEDMKSTLSKHFFFKQLGSYEYMNVTHSVEGFKRNKKALDKL